MDIKLNRKPNKPVIIEGFPGFGLIGTIVTEFLIEQLNAELIGTITVEEAPAMVAIHDGKIVQPIGIYHDKKTNIVIIHVVTSVQGLEWNISKTLVDLANKLSAKELISIEGVGSPVETTNPKCFYYANNEPNKKKFQSIIVDPLKEGIIIGVTGALVLEAGKKVPMSCVFSETHSNLPDSKAAAKVIEVLDKYIGLKINPAPLIQQAEKFEQKIQKIMENGRQAVDQKEMKEMSYVG